MADKPPNYETRDGTSKERCKEEDGDRPISIALEECLDSDRQRVPASLESVHEPEPGAKTEDNTEKRSCELHGPPTSHLYLYTILSENQLI